MPHRSQQQAFLRLARHDNRTGIAPFAERLRGVQTQPPLLFLGAVTLLTALDQDWADLGLEELNLLGSRPGLVGS